MNCFKNILSIVALFSIGSVSAKTVVRKSATSGAESRVSAPASRQAAAVKTKTYKELVASIGANAWDNGNKLLSPTFVNSMIQQVNASGLGRAALISLLQTARDKFAQFTGNNDADAKILMALENQANAATVQMEQ